MVAATGGPPASFSRDNKKIAYLLDVENIRVVDLSTGITVATVNHDAKVCVGCYAPCVRL